VNCPECKSENRRLLESRLTVRGKRRRRFECQVCKYRWTFFTDDSKGRAYKSRWDANETRKSLWRRVSREDALKIITSPLPQRVLAETYGVSRQAISLIQTGSMYKEIYQELYPARKGTVYSCASCASWSRRQCGLGFPEAGGDFATDCCVYSPNAFADVVQ
jgi:transposase-like protein